MVQATTQQILEIEDIREGVVILKNKSVRGVVAVSSLNFSLKSVDEQNAILYQFQNFLNSLDFSIEILVQSRRINLTGYIDKLKELEQQQKNELLKIQTTDYRKFIQRLVASGDIFSRSFYVIVPFYLKQISKGGKSISLSEEQFQRAKFQLWQRIEFVMVGLRRCGLQCIPLNTLELIELFWAQYHPKEAEVGYYPEIPPELAK